jgi:hypothetical protein
MTGPGRQDFTDDARVIMPRAHRGETVLVVEDGTGVGSVRSKQHSLWRY